jgi:hypothetical protein
MFDNLFENRNRTVSELIKLGDYLGRSLRENVSIFKIDVEEKTVCYVTESNKVIAGTYTTDKELALHDIVVEDVSDFTNEDKFNSMVDSKISGFVKNIYEDSHKKAKSSFDDLLYLWESRLKFKSIKTKLEEKTLQFSESSKIINSQEFQNFLEIAPQVVNYLKENKAKVSKIAEIRNAVRLSQTISEAFDMPKTDYDILQEEGSFVVNPTADKSVYEMVCRHELVKKELLENKANFDTVWASSQRVQNLAGLLYSDEKTVQKALKEAVAEVPYLCLASKKQLTETFKNALNLNKVKDINTSDIQQFASAIFEMKKPLKAELINHLNERYGINVQNLKDPATFKSLLNTQVVIFETLAKISPKKSVQRDTLLALAESLKDKNGVEAIDCNEVIQEVFIAAGYDELLINESLNNYLDFDKIASDLDKVGGILRMIKGAGAGEAVAAAMGGQMQKPTPAVGSSPTMQGATSQAPEVEVETPSGSPAPGMEDDDVQVPMTPEDGEEDAMDIEAEDEMGGEEEMGEEEDMGGEEIEPSEEEVMGKMKELEDLIASLKMEIGGGGDVETPEEMPEEDMEEDDLDDEQAELDAEEDAIEAKHEKAHEIEDEAEAEEEGVRAKQKKAEKKEDKLKRMK